MRKTEPASGPAARLPSRAEIAARAYQIYCERGQQHGHDVDDWLQAEYELMRLPIRKIAEMPPPRRTKGGSGHLSLVALVQAALMWGSAALPHLRR